MTKKNQILMDRLAEAARQGKISRREFMHHSIAAGVTTTAATGLWTTSAKAQPKSGGTLRVGLHDNNSADTHDPGTYLSIQQIVLTHTHRSYLTLINTDQSLGGDVAQDWSGSSDATEWTFNLRENVRFHSGKALTADDVIASLNHHRGDDSTSAAKSLLADVVDIVKNGDYSITLKLAGPNADLPWVMTAYQLAMLPANEDGSADWQSADGTGPYRIVEGEFGVGFSLERHDDWHLDGAYFDAVELLAINDPNARQTALVTGDVDAVTAIDLKTMALMSRNPDLQIFNVPSGSSITMPMFCDHEPFFTQVGFRQAMKYAINREEIVEKIAFGAAVIGNDFHHSPALPYYPEGIEQTQYDPDRARDLAKAAGYNGEPIQLSSAESLFSGAVDMAVLYAEHAKAAGINIEVVREPNDGYYSDVWLKKPFCVVAWGSRPTPDVLYTLVYKDDAAWNESRWTDNVRFNELLLQGKSELNDSVREEIYREMAMIAREDGGTIIPFHRNFVYAARSNVGTTGEYAAAWEFDGARAASRWWFT